MKLDFKAMWTACWEACFSARSSAGSSARVAGPVAIAALVVMAMLADWTAPVSAAPRASAHGSFDAGRLNDVRVDDLRGATAMALSGTAEVAFSPNEGSLALVLKAIDSAHSEIRILAYSFTSAPVTRALILAAKRGVSVSVVADEKDNTVEDRSGKARAALLALVQAGVKVRLTRAFAIHHDKVIVVDQQTVETGSFNFSDAAARRNSENVLVLWRNPAVAMAYLDHFERNRRQATTFQPQY